nr:NAD(P)/FAD-dependent oxidoreductase [Nakamurella antarctica]
MSDPDVVVVGSGPNGLAAAVTMARAGLKVSVLEQAPTLGGGLRTTELMMPDAVHDICSAVHPLALVSPFFRDFELVNRIELVVPEISYAHPLRQGVSGIAYKDLDRTAAELGVDGDSWRRLFNPLVGRYRDIVEFTSNQLLQLPRHPVTTALFGLRVLEQGSPAWNMRFRGDVAPAMLSGVNAHSIGAMPSLATSGAGLLLATLGHAVGWPVPIGGSVSIANAMIDDILEHGGTVETGVLVTDLAELGRAKVVLLDVAPRGLLDIAGSRLPDKYRRTLKGFRYGDGAAKVDFVLSGPVPWADPQLAAAPTLHLGGSRAEVAAAEADVAAGRVPEKPYVLLSQPSICDPGRAPQGFSTLWAYCHVPSGSGLDMTEPIIRRIEEFAPAFRDVIVSSRSVTAAGLADYNPNYIGGDFSAGEVSIRQLLKRPILSRTPWRTPLPGCTCVRHRHRRVRV